MKTQKNKKNYLGKGLALALGLNLVAGSIIVSAAPINNIGVEKAKAIALNDARVPASKAFFVKTTLEYENGRKVYDIEFYHNNVEYDYEIDAVTGKIREKDNDINNFVIPTPSSSDIGLEKAKNIALKDAGLSASQVKFVKAHVDFENGRKVYDIEFYRNNVEYDYEVDAATGKILEKDLDIENFVIPAPASSDIGLEKAKNLALKAAGLNASQVRFTKAKVDFEDGRKVYDIEFYHNNVEYNIEIDASSGKVREYDVDTDDAYYNNASSNNGNYNDYDDDDHDDYDDHDDDHDDDDDDDEDYDD